MASISASGTSVFSLNVSAWLWQRIAPTRTQSRSTGTAGAPTGAPAEDLVGLGAALPLLEAGAVAEVDVDPGDQAAAERNAEMRGLGVPLIARWRSTMRGRSRGSRYFGSSSSVAHLGVQRAVLRQQFAHVLRPAARRRLVGHARHPLDQAGLEQRADAHQHAADGAVAADPVAHAPRQRAVDHRPVDRVEDDDRVVLHAQGLGGVDPVAVPAGGAQPRIDVLGVLAALRGDDDPAALQRLEVVRVLQLGLVLGERRRACRPCRWC